MISDPRLEEVRALVRAGGFPHADVESGGHDGSIAVIRNVPATAASALARLAPAIRTLGFRYVAVDITPPES
ncbi:MAG: hypothetical protein FIB01_15045 [Gemmatimonadetes bacterium]|nr:hypothetical protein [Gemmatimonadota bacterium]